MIDQIRTIDKKRILKIFGTISKKEIESVKNVIKEIFVD
jgi:mRNA interferase MazF